MVRRDPRAEPTTVPPPPSDVVEVEPSLPATSTVPQRGSRNDTPMPSEVQGLAQFRHKLAALQSQLADVQRLLADEQRERAEEADQLARMLKHVATADARVHDAEARAVARLSEAARELADERAIAQQLGKSLTQQEDDCVALRGQVLDLEQRLDNTRADASAQITAYEQELGTVKERLIDLQANEGELKRQLLDAVVELDAMKAATTELSNAKNALDESQKDATQKTQELARMTNQLKQAHMKAFTATKQLESWKVESQRAMDQLRNEQESTAVKQQADHQRTIATLARDFEQAVAKLARERDDKIASVEKHTAALSKELETSADERRALRTEADGLRRELDDSRARAASMRQQLEAAIKMLTLTSEALEAAERAEIEMQNLRATQEQTRRQLLEQALGVRNALKRASEDAPRLEVSETELSEDIDEK